MKYLSNVIFVAADTIRSRAYASAMMNAGFCLDKCLVISSSQKSKMGQSFGNVFEASKVEFDGLYMPDLNCELTTICSKISHEVETIDAGTVNTESVESWLETNNPRLVVFSGFGGEIVKKNILSAAGPFLHIHSGWLPKYKGSTTIYYSYLAEGSMAVSALLLSEEIDSGKIISRKSYPVPPKDVDIDYLYDSAIRSDLLVEVLGDVDGILTKPSVDSSSEISRDYYIIHPVLKHIALIKLNKL